MLDPELLPDPEPLLDPELLPDPEPLLDPELLPDPEPLLDPELLPDPEPLLDPEPLVESVAASPFPPMDSVPPHAKARTPLPMTATIACDGMSDP